MRFAPFLLDPSTPIEGKPRKQMSQPDSPPSAMEARGATLGAIFSRGRQWTSNSLLAHEASEFITEHESPEIAWAFHRAMFKAYFTDFADVAKQDLLLEVANSSGVSVDPLRTALEARSYQEQVMDGLRWARQAGVTAVPTFVFDDQYALVGAQDLAVMEQMMQQLGKQPR